ncbi:hypothetical protein E2C01_100891 [Portunus trituberculatus]|uniref:Uncharacterized protein n=1 Tax=Portunus trituberculatus TaxID=210409 RepID=A0A5B7KDC9_PORTR|nr:hypothetical protein [Portunus trituberculatus]
MPELPLKQKKTVTELSWKAVIGGPTTERTLLAGPFYRHRDIFTSRYPQIPVIKKWISISKSATQLAGLRKSQISATSPSAITDKLHSCHAIPLVYGRLTNPSTRFVS